jgi:transcriptional regulator with XRE-family HTH domain
MDEEIVTLATIIGTRVKRARVAHGWTLDHLADTAEVSRRMLVNIEHGLANPTVGLLLKLSDALGIGLPDLVEPLQTADIRITRAAQGAKLWQSSNGGCGVLVAGTTSPETIELWDWTLASGDCHESDPHVAGNRELLLVVDGTVEVRVGNEVATLEKGDAAIFSGSKSHSYRNPGSGIARFSLAVFESRVRLDRKAEVING